MANEWDIYDHVEWAFDKDKAVVEAKAKEFEKKGWYVFFRPKQNPQSKRWVCGATKDKDALKKFVDYGGEIAGVDY